MKVLQADDLKAGMKVVVHAQKSFELERITANGPEGVITAVHSKGQGVPSGDILIIKAVDLPYIIVETVGYPPFRYSKDTRRTTFAKPSRAYVNAIMNKKKV